MSGRKEIRRLFPKVMLVLVILLSSSPLFSQTTLKIMPLGNSITRGSMCLNGNINGCVLNSDADAIGYRFRLYNLLNAAGYNFDFVGVS